MSPEAQRIAIAEACGWRKEDTSGLLMKFRPWIHKNTDGEDHKNWKTDAQLPDYLNDLNAMHEAEKVLTGHQADEYTEILTDRVYRYHEGDRHWAKSEFFAIHATAAQRAEALLKTLGKWEDGK